MRPSRTNLAPVITLLSPSPAASRKAQEILGSVFGLQEEQHVDFLLEDAPTTSTTTSRSKDPLNAKFQSPLLPATMSKQHWDSVASKCPTSGAVIHCLAIGNGNSRNDSSEPSSNTYTSSGAFELLGITGTGTSTSTDTPSVEDSTNDTRADTSATASIASARRLLSSHFPNSLFSFKLRHWMQRPITADALLKRHQGLPVLDLNLDLDASAGSGAAAGNDEGGSSSSSSNNNIRLKEVAFTIYDDAVYEDGSTVQSQLSQSSLLRPVTGVYEWPNNDHSHSRSAVPGVCLRPLPAAKRDLRGSSRPVVLAFHCDSVDQILEEYQARLVDSHSKNDAESPAIHFSKIGYTGQKRGQLRLQATNHNSGNNKNSLINYLPGLDIRWCESTKPMSMFNEAQESLLASSLLELQSTNVLKATGSQEPGLEDERIGSSDCWTEVRTMVRNPRGFVSGKGPKIATAPPSYPE